MDVPLTAYITPIRQSSMCKQRCSALRFHLQPISTGQTACMYDSIAIYGYPTYFLYTPVRQQFMRIQHCSVWEGYLPPIHQLDRHPCINSIAVYGCATHSLYTDQIIIYS